MKKIQSFQDDKDSRNPVLQLSHKIEPSNKTSCIDTQKDDNTEKRQARKRKASIVKSVKSAFLKELQDEENKNLQFDKLKQDKFKEKYSKLLKGPSSKDLKRAFTNYDGFESPKKAQREIDRIKENI